MRKLFYCGLEPYVARYSYQLQQWNEAVFKRRNIDYEIVAGELLDNSQAIVTGSVLDAHGRSYFSLTQMSNLVKMMREGKVTNEDVLFFEDAFTPGLESLPYIMDQVPAEYRPKVFVRFLAQTTDPDDFVMREGMFRWMRPFEQVLDNFVDGIIVANEEFVAHLRICGFKAPIYVSGLPFGKEEVQSRVPNRKPLNERMKRVVFAARWDDEKQPHFYMDLAERFYNIDPEVEFCILSGHKELKSNNQEYVNRAYSLQESNTANFKIYTGLQKNEYYGILADSMVLFNCALQDWQSNTYGEALALGTIPLYPAYRSFPETTGNNHEIMYMPWSQEHATKQLMEIFKSIKYGYDFNLQSNLDWINGAIDRTVDIMSGTGEQWGRNSIDYRREVSKRKFT